VLRHAEDPNAFAVGLKHLTVVVDAQDQTVQSVTELRERREALAEAAARSRSAAVQAAHDAAQTLRLVEELRAQAQTIADEIARDEARQREVLATLEADEAENAALLARVEVRQRELEGELAARRAADEEERRRAEERARKRGNGSAGAGGGAPMPGGYCPVVGAVASRDFSNDWGFPRSGGRTHQGNDIFAPTGTPIVAIDDAVIVRVNARDTGLGGLTVTYRTADGSEWYNAHLDGIASGLAPGVTVAAGTEVGYVGRTGNARTTPPHNHIGRRVGGTWVNPWPTIAPLCR
jgi:murein DD-endopeptidase MepM/ murein hydrolase activator NlpD